LGSSWNKLDGIMDGSSNVRELIEDEHGVFKPLTKSTNFSSFGNLLAIFRCFTGRPANLRILVRNIVEIEFGIANVLQ